jgi:hypothetical protein
MTQHEGLVFVTSLEELKTRGIYTYTNLRRHSRMPTYNGIYKMGYVLQCPQRLGYSPGPEDMLGCIAKF